MESLSEAIVHPVAGACSTRFGVATSASSGAVNRHRPVGYALAVGLSGRYSPSQILVVGFGFAAVLWPAPLSIERVRNAA